MIHSGVFGPTAQNPSPQSRHAVITPFGVGNERRGWSSLGMPGLGAGQFDRACAQRDALRQRPAVDSDPNAAVSSTTVPGTQGVTVPIIPSGATPGPMPINLSAASLAPSVIVASDEKVVDL